MSKTIFTVDKEKLEVRMERIYKATPERLFEAMTNPEQIVKWWGPRDLKTTIEQDDLKVGGKWRYIHTEANGTRHVFYGEYKEIDQPNKISRTFEYEPWAGHVLVETATLTAHPDGTTLFNSVAKYANLEDLEGMVQSGMEKG